LTERPWSLHPSGEAFFVLDCSRGPFLGTIWAHRKTGARLGSFSNASHLGHAFSATTHRFDGRAEMWCGGEVARSLLTGTCISSINTLHWWNQDLTEYLQRSVGERLGIASVHTLLNDARRNLSSLGGESIDPVVSWHIARPMAKAA
jgi:hypothetical protein